MTLLKIIRKRVSYIPQMQVTECGAASLTMVLAYHGHNASLPEVRQACGVSRDGANALSIVRAARGYGLDAKGAKVELQQISQIPLPAILHWDFNHFVVLEKVNNKKVFIVDPACGKRILEFNEASRHFTGVALVFVPTSAFTKKEKKNPSISRYKEIFRKSVPNLIQILLGSIALQITGLLFPVANQILLDRVILPIQEKWLWGLAFALGGAVVVKALLTLIRSYVIQGLQYVLDISLMGRFLDHLLRLPLGFFLQRETGDLVQRVQSNATVRNLLSSQSISALLDVFLLSGYAALMIAYAPMLGFTVVTLSAIRAGLFLAYRETNQQIMASELAALGREGGALVECMMGLETTKATKGDTLLIQRWANRMFARVNSSLQRRKLAINMEQAVVLIQGCTTAGVFLLGGHEVLTHHITIGVFTSFLMLQNLFITPLGTLLETLTQLQYAGNHLLRLDDVLETSQETSGEIDPGRLKGAIELRDVSFSYSPGAPPVLKNISLSIKPGEKIALVGSSGAGKSTLASLLLGMHLPSAGDILFDGRNLREQNLHKLRKQMGVVLQDTFLFDDTIRANLSLHDSSIPFERLQQAAKIACIDRVIEKLPGGYSARIGENGNLLSGGERQRLNLARALANEPAILLLDEATSSLDLATEALLHANLASIGCTRIIIAHRLATVKDADRIYVMNQGQIIQSGSYSELEACDGFFHTLTRSMSEDVKYQKHFSGVSNG